MNILERIKKEKRFVEETSVILDKLFVMQIERVATNQDPPKEILLDEFHKFTHLAQQGKIDGISSGFLFQRQDRNLIEAFKFFDDIVPGFKAL